jgi:chemotaxis protein MotA
VPIAVFRRFWRQRTDVSVPAGQAGGNDGKALPVDGSFLPLLRPCPESGPKMGEKPMPGLLNMIDPLPLLAVVAGALAIATIQIGGTSFGPAFSALTRLFRADPDADRDFARATLGAVDRIAQLHGISRTDRVKARPGFLAEAVHRLADGADIDRFALWAGQSITDRADRHGRVIAFWDAVADAAPAMGMAGTILGLVSMFAGMDDPATIGPAMALALLTTFHGMVIANMVAGPIARRLERLSAAEIAWQRALAEQLVAIGRREALPPVASPAAPRKSALREVA